MGELQKVQELPEVITKCNVAVRFSQERTHTFHQILKGAHDRHPQTIKVKYISWIFLHLRDLPFQPNLASCLDILPSLTPHSHTMYKTLNHLPKSPEFSREINIKILGILLATDRNTSDAFSKTFNLTNAFLFLSP